jgi:hypothetical protein
MYLSFFLSLSVIQVMSLLLAGTMTAYLDAARTMGPMDVLLRTNTLMQDDGLEDRLLHVEADNMLEQARRLDMPLEPVKLNNGDAIDNYYSRLHMDRLKKPILVVGGSDGSGTRAMVDALGRLGVAMLIDDTGTMDIDAVSLFDGKGWPQLVETILNITHSADYEFDDLPTSVQEQVRGELEKLKEEYERRAVHLLAKGKTENKRVAQGVEYGFKAPASLLLLPLLREVYGSIKFLHVVRDGRDVAFSKNQSPVRKFYDVYYKNATERRSFYDQPESKSIKEVMGMQLWNDWNLQTLEWEKKHTDGDSFDYLVMRAEDLVDPVNKFESLTRLAGFVGSQKTPEELCCLSQQAVVDLGKSARSDANGLFNILDEVEDDTRLSPGVKSKLARMDQRMTSLLGDLDRLQVDRGNHRDNMRHHREKKIYSTGTNISERREKLERLKQQSGTTDYKGIAGRRLFGAEQSDESTRETSVPEVKPKGRFGSERSNLPKPATNYLAEKEKQRLEEEKYDEDLMLEDSIVDARRKHKQVDKLKEKFGKTSSHSRKQIASTRGLASSEQVQKRYGRWISKLEGRPELSALLHSQGSAALKAFGYEPAHAFMDRGTDRGFQCDADVVCTNY